MGNERQVAGPLSLIGTPYIDGGRDRQGADCWGLVCIAYSEYLGITLPSYGEISAQDLRAVSREMSAGAELWHRVDAPQYLDVVLMKAPGRRVPVHVGLIVGNAVLHSEKASDAVLVPLSHENIKNRIAGVFRYGGYP